MRKYILLLLSLSLFLHCSKDDAVPASPQILGEWKLVSARIANLITVQTVDYSDQNIIYDFRANGVLWVSQDNMGYAQGTYEYVFEEDYLSGSPSPGENKGWLVKVNNIRKWIYQRVDGKMLLRTSYIDGPDLTFEKN